MSKLFVSLSYSETKSEITEMTSVTVMYKMVLCATYTMTKNCSIVLE
jgi:hypothetical protein